MILFLWGGMNCHHPLRDGLLDEDVTVAAFVGKQVFGADPRYQLCSFSTIRRGALCDNGSNRHTMCIHAQMWLGVKPPFVRLMA